MSQIYLPVTSTPSVPTQFTVQTGSSPVVPAANNLNFNGAAVAAGTNPVRTNGTGPATMELDVQISQAIAASNVSNIGLCAFNSSQFSVDANGFVSMSISGLAWLDQGSNFTPLVNTGYFITASGVIATLPAAPSQGNTIEFITDFTPGSFTIQANAGQKIRVGLMINSATGGTATTSAQGNTVELIFRSSDNTWIAGDNNGTWSLS